MAVFSGLSFLFLTTTLLSPSVNGQLRDSLTPSQTLPDDGASTLISASGKFALGFFTPPGASDQRYVGIWYHSISDYKTVVWVANRRRPLTGPSGRLSLTLDGILIVTVENSTAVVWSSSPAALKKPIARLLDDGNFVVEDTAASGSGGDSGYGWQSFDFPTNTLLPGMKLGWNLTAGSSRNLTAWRSSADPAPGEYVAGLDAQGQLFVWQGAEEYWRGGPWNGLRFSGVPEMVPANAISVEYKFLSDAHQIVYWFDMANSSTISRLVMEPSGALTRFLWNRGSWASIGSQPPAMDPCNRVSTCGPNGICRSGGSPMCECLKGYRPKNQESWDKEDWSLGCAMEATTTALMDCHGRSDWSVPLTDAKLPDASRSTVNWSSSLTLDQCRALCLGNCSCVAYASANVSGRGSGCRIWSGELTDLTVYPAEPGQDLYVRQVAAADAGSESGQSHRRRNLVIVAVVAALASFLLACVIACCIRRKKRGRLIEKEAGEQESDLPLFDFSTIADATGNFSADNLLGQGGFGPVYRGKLEKGQEIAVKRLSQSSTQGADEFRNELVLIAKLQHRNLVRLLGCCIQKGERMLIYEYMPNGSLDAILFDGDRSRLLDWPARYKIILGIARGILYLHHDSRLRIIHRDLKASNVLLDRDMNPKISDFGTARIFGGDDSEANTRKVVGTYGYMSPEYAMEGIFSVKSDVFSFGVLVLEIISGKQNRGAYQSTPYLNLLGHIWSLWREEKALELVDRSIIREAYPMGEIMRCIKIGLLCVQEQPRDRPTIYSAVKMLDCDTTFLPEPKQPGFVHLRDPHEINSTSASNHNFSANNISTGTLEAR